MYASKMAPRWRQVLAWLACLLAMGSGIALIALLINLSCIQGTTADSRSRLLASSALNIISLVALIVFGGSLLLRLHGRRSLQNLSGLILLTANAILLLIATCVSLAALCLAHQDARHLSTNDVDDAKTTASAGIAVCCLYILSQVAVLGLAFSPISPPSDNRLSRDNEGSFVASSELKNSPSTINKSTYSNDSPGSPWPVQSSFPTTPPKRTRVRESVQSLLQPKASMQRLIRHASFQSTTTGTTERRDSWGNRPDAGFDNWTVDHDDPYVERPAPYTSTRLHPIPASRPASPAKPLDGPFPSYDVPDSPTSPTPATFRSDSLPGSIGQDQLPAPGRRPSLGLRVRTSDEERHIHPLFRTDSPVSPPLVSPGTTVTAFPLGGQALPYPPSAWRPASRHSSRPGSPGTFSARPGSAQSSASRHPGLRSVRSEESVASGPVRANMPPRLHPGIMYADEQV